MKFIIVFFSLLLCSCAVPVAKQKEQLSSKNICCNSIDEFDYRKVDLVDGVTLKFNEIAQVYDFGDGKTYLSAIELPINLDNRVVSVESDFNGSLIGQYFDPIFLVLNDYYEGIEVFSLKLRFKKGEFLGNPNAHMTGMFTLAPGAKYIVVFTGKFDNQAPIAQLAPSSSMVMVGNSPMFFLVKVTLLS